MWLSARKGDDHLSLPTYAQDLFGHKPSVIFTSIHGRSDGSFTLGLAITDVDEREVAAHMPLVRARAR